MLCECVCTCVNVCVCVGGWVSYSWKLFEYCIASAFSHKKFFSSPKAKNSTQNLLQIIAVVTISAIRNESAKLNRRGRQPPLEREWRRRTMKVIPMKRGPD